VNSDLCFIVRRKGPAIKQVYVRGYIMLVTSIIEDQTVDLFLKDDR